MFISIHSIVTDWFNGSLHKYAIITAGYSVVKHNNTITSSQKGATGSVNQQQLSATPVDDKVRGYWHW